MRPHVRPLQLAAKAWVRNVAVKLKVLFAGESWITHSIHVKGFDSFESSSYHEGGTELIAALQSGNVAVTYQPSHLASNSFPVEGEALAAFDVVILSDIGANTLLLSEQAFVRSQRTANRLELLADFVRAGGGLLMIGGYLTFQGIQAKGNYHGSPVEDVLPVLLDAGDDRRECPQGIAAQIVNPAHPVVAGLADWPHFLGYNRAALRPDAVLVASFGDDPLIAVRQVGRGRTGVFSSDCGPHWGPPAFVSWPGYPRLWLNLVHWLAGRAYPG
jgi:uncharacterized membrane protein